MFLNSLDKALKLTLACNDERVASFAPQVGNKARMCPLPGLFLLEVPGMQWHNKET